MALKNKDRTVLGVDASTNSFAFCLYGKDGPIKWGEIDFEGKNVFERLADGQKKVLALGDELTADLIVFESAVFVQNKKTVILLAYSFGAIVSALMTTGAEIKEASPLAWQNYIGNKPLTKPEKQAIVEKTPKKSKSWYSNAFREFRKQRTMQWAKDQFGITVESDNVSDAIGLSYYAYHKC
jgi:Holliday junction resolvasome RuvABC endonuclease subunit